MANVGRPGVVRTCGELQGTWEEIANAIKSGTEFKVGDYKKGSTVDDQGFTLVVTYVTDKYVRFESRDCVGEEAEWNKNGGTQLSYPGSDIHKYLNKGLFERLEYYKNHRNRMRGSAEGEDTESWWLASVRSGASAYACYVSDDGGANDWYTSYAARVLVCFIIKKS